MLKALLNWLTSEKIASKISKRQCYTEVKVFYQMLQHFSYVWEPVSCQEKSQNMKEGSRIKTSCHLL